VEIAQSECNLYGIKLDFFFLKPSSGLKEPIEFTSSNKRHDKKESEFTHKQVLHADQELMLTFKHNLFFQLGIFDLVVLYQNVLPNHLYRVQLSVLLEFCQEHLPEGAFAENDYHFEVRQSRPLCIGIACSLDQY